MILFENYKKHVDDLIKKILHKEEEFEEELEDEEEPKMALDAILPPSYGHKDGSRTPNVSSKNHPTNDDDPYVEDLENNLLILFEQYRKRTQTAGGHLNRVPEIKPIGTEIEKETKDYQEEQTKEERRREREKEETDKKLTDLVKQQEEVKTLLNPDEAKETVQQSKEESQEKERGRRGRAARS